jgi:acetoin utilization protein AcuB
MSSKTVGECMTPNPVSVSAETSLVAAGERMREHGIRHLPILDRGALVGLISERDLALIAGIPGIDGDRVAVTEAMSPNPYVVPSSASLSEVVAVMHERKLGTAVVMDGGELRGVFSVIDALAVLRQMLEESRCSSTPESTNS